MRVLQFFLLASILLVVSILALGQPAKPSYNDSLSRTVIKGKPLEGLSGPKLTQAKANEAKAPTTIEIINAVASVTSALGFIMVLFQFWYTRKKDVEDGKNAQKDQMRKDNQFNQQLSLGHIQQFESSLFSLLNLFDQVVIQLKFRTSTDLHGDPYLVDESGRGVFNEVALRVKHLCEMPILNDPDDPDNRYTHPVGSVAEARYRLEISYYDNYYTDFEEVLNHYFRSLYHIFKYIDSSELIRDERKLYYASLVCSQLSQNELLAIMFNLMIQGYGYPRFLLLDKKYHILHNFRHDASFLQPYYQLYVRMREDVGSGAGEEGISPVQHRSMY